MKKELLSIMFLLGVSLSLLNILPYFNQNGSIEAQFNERKNTNQSINEINKSENVVIPVTFDIIRISQDGDAVMAGKSEPNLEMFLFENNKKIASFFSDANGEWVWISDRPLTQGLKVFNVKCFGAGKEFESSQEIYVLGDNMSLKKPIVLKLDSSNLDDIDIYNTDYIDNGLTLDLLNYYPKKKLTVSGRAPVGTEVKVFANDILLGNVSTDFYGNWKFSSKEIVNINSSKLKFLTSIAGKKFQINLPLSLSQLEQKIFKTSSTKIIKESNSWRLTRKISDETYLYSEIFIRNSNLYSENFISNLNSFSISQLFKSERNINNPKDKI
tara:strand:- start:1412 stop:2395 length:984 start_codon:yes stop_codon:yes gene_type:complete